MMHIQLSLPHNPGGFVVWELHVDAGTDKRFLINLFVLICYVRCWDKPSAY